MNIDVNHIPQWLWTFLLSPAGAIIGIGIVSVLGLKFLAKNPGDVKYAKAVLISVHELMKNQLGDKAEAVYQAWLSGLDSIADGEFTTEEMIAELTKFIKIALGKQNISLNPSEEAVVVQAATMSSQVMAVSSKSTKKAVAMMMAKRG